MARERNRKQQGMAECRPYLYSARIIGLCYLHRLRQRLKVHDLRSAFQQLAVQEVQLFQLPVIHFPCIGVECDLPDVIVDAVARAEAAVGFQTLPAVQVQRDAADQPLQKELATVAGHGAVFTEQGVLILVHADHQAMGLLFGGYKPSSGPWSFVLDCLLFHSEGVCLFYEIRHQVYGFGELIFHTKATIEIAGDLVDSFPRFISCTTSPAVLPS